MIICSNFIYPKIKKLIKKLITIIIAITIKITIIIIKIIIIKAVIIILKLTYQRSFNGVDTILNNENKSQWTIFNWVLIIILDERKIAMKWTLNLCVRDYKTQGWIIERRASFSQPTQFIGNILICDVLSTSPKLWRVK